MQNQWALDKSKAAKVGQSAYISGNTAEIYQIQSAAWKANAKQDGSETYYLSLHIINSERSSAHIDIYYGNSAGEHWSGENLIHAMMLCANVPAISQAQGQYQEYDFDVKKDVTRTGFIAPELAGKKVGMFLAENYYFNSNQGEVKKGGLNLFNVFDAKTRQLPIEKANNQPANPDEFNRVLEATIKSSEKSLEKANSQAGTSNSMNNQFVQNTQQPLPQQGPVTYKRQVAPQQAQQPTQQQGFNNQMTAAATPGPSDDDIPFAPFFGG
ncbi:hypothetical protein [Psychrobacter sp. H7-1]|uniref:hypothetical protein n=1 Tax=Psychrobacter sp. H7-1 TaxID=1569265 RepID=UPI001919CC2A|nr:hypothetical protein [Psychrobacter sp. H7-1]